MSTATQEKMEILYAGDKIRAGKAQCYWLHFTCLNKFPGHLSFDYDDLAGLTNTMIAYKKRGVKDFRIEAGNWDDYEDRSL